MRTPVKPNPNATMPERADFAARLWYTMEREGITQEALHQMTGIAQPTIAHYTTGARQPKVDKLVKIARALHVSLDWLCGMD